MNAITLEIRDAATASREASLRTLTLLTAHRTSTRRKQLSAYAKPCPDGVSEIDWLIMRHNAEERSQLELALCANFDTRWMGELPLVFSGTVAECVAYAHDHGYLWAANPDYLFGGTFVHPTEPNTLFPV